MTLVREKPVAAQNTTFQVMAAGGRLTAWFRTAAGNTTQVPKE